MTQPNPDAGRGQQYPASGPPIVPGRPVANPRQRRGIKAVAAGAILFALALATLVFPFGLFILGGGGDTEAFGELQRGFAIAAAVIAALGLAVLVSGTITVLTSRRHP